MKSIGNHASGITLFILTLALFAFDPAARAAQTRPVFLLHPVSSNVPLGSDVTLKVVVRADPPATLQWFRNNSPVAGATGSELKITGLTLATAGQYSVTAVNALGTAQSATGVVDANVVTDPFAPGLSPEVTVFAGSKVLFNAATTGTAPITHSWFLNGNVIPSATSPLFQITSVHASDQGRYFYSAQGPVKFNNAFTDLAVQPLESSFSRRGLGTVSQVAAIDGGSYVATGDSVFWILKTSTPGLNGVNYSELGKVSSVVADGSRLFKVALNEKFIKVFSLANPELPELIASYQPSAIFTADLRAAAVRWPLVYFALGDLGMHIVDFSNPASPALLGSYAEANHPANDVKLTGNIAALSLQTGGLVLLDISNPASPSLKGRSTSSQFASRAVLRGTDALVDSGASQVYVFDIANPASPSLKSTVHTAGPINDLLLRNDQLFVAEDAKIEVFDVATPASLSLAVTYDVQARSLAISDQTLIVASAFGGVTGIDLRDSPAILNVFPGNQTVGVGGEIRILANAVGAPPLRYQWFKGASPVQNATNSILQLTLADASFATSYHVEVTTKTGFASSGAVTVQLDGNISAPDVSLLTGGPIALKPAQTVNLSALVTGSPAPSLQWLSNSVPVSGANAATLVLGPLPANVRATYQLKASNAAGEKTSTGISVFTVPDAAPKLTLSIIGGKAEVRSSDGLGFRWLVQTATSLGGTWSPKGSKTLSNQNQLVISLATNISTGYFRLVLP